MSADNIQIVIQKINAVYRTWNRTTPITQMRKDWDNLFHAPASDTTTSDFRVGDIRCRWTDGGDTSDYVMLYIHGGGFRLGSIDSHQRLVSELAKSCRLRVLSFDYRLMPEHRFPDQLDDTIAVFDALLAQGVPAAKIVVAGDSAGGNLGAALMQWLKQHGRDLPRAMVLISPWLDMTLSGASYEARAALDPIHQKKMLQVLADEYLGDRIDPRDPLASPVFGDLHDLPPTLIHFGEREVGLDDAVSYREKALACGSEVTLEVWPHMIHVFHTFVDELPEASAAIAKIGVFVRSHIDA